MRLDLKKTSQRSPIDHTDKIDRAYRVSFNHAFILFETSMASGDSISPIRHTSQLETFRKSVQFRFYASGKFFRKFQIARRKK